jgi:hypothetical protein
VATSPGIHKWYSVWIRPKLNKLGPMNTDFSWSGVQRWKHGEEGERNEAAMVWILEALWCHPSLCCWVSAFAISLQCITSEYCHQSLAYQPSSQIPLPSWMIFNLLFQSFPRSVLQLFSILPIYLYIPCHFLCFFLSRYHFLWLPSPGMLLCGERTS